MTMSRKNLASSLLAVILLLGWVQQRSIATAVGFNWTASPFEEVTDDTSESVEATSDDSDSTAAPQKKKGNGFVRALSAPFRALGRLFNGGSKKNNDPQTARRSSGKDAPKFGGTTLTRIKDARSEQNESPTPGQGPAVSSSIIGPPVNVHLVRGRQLISAGDLDGAIAELSLAASIDASNAEVQNLMGVAYESKGLRQRALESFAAAVRADKKNAQYLNNYGFLLYQSGDADEATKYLKRAARLSPNDARIWNNLGLAQCGRGKFDDAFESFARAVGQFHGHLNVATQAQQNGYAKEAIRHLQIAQTMNPNSADVLTKLVSLYEMTGRPTDAEAARRSLVALKTFADANK